MTGKVISVIVPIYNVEKYLKKSLDSLLGQTYQNLEIILVDDGSTDGCPKICDDYQKSDSRVQVIHKKNGGLSDARNAGFEKATGEYIAFFDSDDYLKEDAMERLITAIEMVDADMAVCNFETVTPEGIIIPERNKHQVIKDEVIEGREAICRLCGPNYEYYVTAWNRLYKKEVVEGTLFPKGKIHEDEFTAHLFYAKAKRIACVEYAAYCYVVREDSIMTKKYSKRNLDYFEALSNRIRYCIEQRIDEVVLPFVNWMLKDLALAYGKLDFSEEGCADKYKYCKEQYFKLRRNVKIGYRLSLKNTILTMLLRISPALANKVVKCI